MDSMQTLRLPWNIKSHIGISLAYLDLIMADSKGQRQGYVHFDCEYL